MESCKPQNTELIYLCLQQTHIQLLKKKKDWEVFISFFKVNIES